jgi:hypothetical protein
MFKCRTAEKNDLESIYKKSSIFVANSYTHYKNSMVKFLFFFSFFVALNYSFKFNSGIISITLQEKR